MNQEHEAILARPLEIFGIENPDINMKEALEQLEDEDKDKRFQTDGIDPMKILYKGKLLVDLEGNFKAFWDYLQLVVILYISMTAPFKVAFVEDYEYLWWDIFDHFMDFLVLIDMIIVFFTPFYVNYQLVTSHA